MKKIIFSLSLILFAYFTYSQNNTPEYDIYGNTNSLNRVVNVLQKPGNTESGNEWFSLGPFGGDVVDMAIDPTNQKVFIAASKPYMRDSEGGEWQVVEELFSFVPNGVSAIETNSEGVIFASGESISRKIFKSIDHGSTWQQFNLPSDLILVDDIATTPSNPDIVYVASLSNLASTENKVIGKSEDGGSTWTVFNVTSLFPVGCNCIDVTIDPDNSETIFALGKEGLSNGRAIASFDAGLTWTNVASGLPSGKPYNEVTIKNGVVYISGGQAFGGNYMGIYKSEDYGMSWTCISTDFPVNVVNDVLIHPDDANKIFAATEGGGVYHSLDGGETWVYNTGGAGDNGSAQKIIFKQDNPSTIYGGFSSLGVCLSTNDGIDWTLYSEGIASMYLADIEVDMNNPEIILTSYEAQNSGGCYLYHPDAGEWALVENLPATRFASVSIGIDGTMYAFSNGPSSVAQEGVYKSTDGGDNWVNMGPNIGAYFETQIFSMVLSETDPDLIFIAGNNFGNNGWASIIYRTTDGGENWENVFIGPENDGFKYIFIDPTSSDQTIYAAYKSEDFKGGFKKSTDGGDNWFDINDGIPSETKWAGAIVCDINNPDLLYAGAGGYGGTVPCIYKSENGGSSWVAMSISTGNYSKINDLLISPLNSNIAYASTSGNGVFITEDGMNWTASNDGMPTSAISGFSRLFTHDEDSLRFYASTFTNSAFYTKLYDPSGVGIEQWISSTDDQIVVSPNPSVGDVTIDLRSLNTSVYSISIYNTNGKIVINELALRRNKGEGEHSFKLNLNAGIYFVVVNTDKRVYSKKLIVVK